MGNVLVRRPSAKRILLPLVALAVVLSIWELLARLELVNTFFLPAPSTLSATLVELATDGFPDGILLQTHVLVTLKRSFLGFLIAAALGIPIGILVGYFGICLLYTSDAADD